MSHFARFLSPVRVLILLVGGSLLSSAGADEILINPAGYGLTTTLVSQEGGTSRHSVSLTNRSSAAYVGPLRVEVTGASNAQCEHGGANSKKGGKSGNPGNCGNAANMAHKITNGSTSNGLPTFLLPIPSLAAGASIEFEVASQGGAINIDSVNAYQQDDGVMPPMPSVTIGSPANLATLGSSPVLVTGEVNEYVDMLTLNGITVAFGGGAFSAYVDLEEGFNTIVARALDGDGNAATASVSVSLDLTPPYLTLDSQVDGQLVATQLVTITGQVNDIVRGTIGEEDAQVLINGVPASVSQKSYAGDVTLVPGINTLVVQATDAVGNVSSLTFTLNYQEPVGPKVAINGGNSQTAQIGTLLPVPMSVLVTAAGGIPQANKDVIFTVEQGSGSFPGGKRALVVQSDTNGVASTPFTVGNRVGAANQKVNAVVNGYNAVTFNASTTGLPPNKISVNAGNNQRGGVGSQLPAPLIITATDSGANVVPNAAVEFSVVSGGGKMGNGLLSQTFTTDSQGRAAAQYILGPTLGVDEQRIRATIVGTALTATFSATAFIPGDPGNTSISGAVLDNQDQPVPGVTVRVDGTTRQAIADASGKFKITNAPVGPVRVVADGSTATVPGEYPSLSYNIVTIAGVNNPMIAPIYMVRLQTENRVFAGPQDVTLTLASVPGFSLEIKKDSVTFPDGSRQGFISVTPVNASKMPKAPPDGMQPQLIVTIQPEGARFDPPARLTLPNVEGKAPGEQFEMFSYDHDLEDFVGIGLGTVSNNGLVVRSNPGVGVVKAGWHCGAQPNETGSVSGTSSELCESETVNVLNRISNVLGNGTFTIDNVPSNQGFVQATSTCVKSNGTVKTGKSSYFSIVTNQTVSAGSLVYTTPAPVPVSLAFAGTADISLVVGNTHPLMVTATFSNSTTDDVTHATGINFASTNAAVASVDANGLVTAQGAGFALVIARLDGVVTTRGVIVSGGTMSDTDGDGLDDDIELQYGLDPIDPVDALQDVDNDGLTAAQEIAAGTDINNSDTDGDGLSDGEEVAGGTSPLLADTDGDGVRDGLEVAIGTDPNDAQDVNFALALSELEIGPAIGSILFNTLLGEGSTQLTLNGLMLDGATIDLTSQGSYDSSDLNICTPSGAGLVNAGQSGVCQITASYAGLEATSLIQVQAFSAVSSGYVDLSGPVSEIAVLGDYAYVASYDAGIQIVDVSDRNAPVVLGTFASGDARDIAIEGSIAFVVNGFAGIRALDLSVPSAPVQLGTLSLGSNANAIVVFGNRAYTTAPGGTTYVVDISDPANMGVIGSINVGGNALDVDGTLMAIAVGPTVQLISLADESAPAIIGSGIVSSNAQDIDFVNGALLVAAGAQTNGLFSYDVSVPGSPTLQDQVPIQNSGIINDLRTRNGLTFGADTFFANGVSITDSRFAPALAANQILNFANIRDDNGVAVDVDDQYVYLLGEHPNGYRLYIGQYIADASSSQFVPQANNPGMLEFYGTSQFWDESETAFQIFVRRSQGTQGVVSVNYSTSSGTAIAGQDFNSVSGTLTWGDGDDSLKAFTIPIIHDSDIEPTEYLIAKLSNITGGAVLGTATTLPGLIDDEQIPGGSGVIGTRVYGPLVDEDVGSVTLTVARLAGSTGAISADYSGPAPGSDPDTIGSTSGTLNWADGDKTTRQITVPILDDFTPEVLHRGIVSFLNFTGGTWAIFNPEIYVTDQDGGPLAGRLEFTTRSYRNLEGQPSVEFTVIRKGSSFGVVSVNYSLVSNGTATVGVDHSDVSGTLTWGDGDNSSRTFTVPILDDSDIEPIEYFLAFLSNPTGGAEAGPFSVGLIVDDDFDGDDYDGDGYPNFLDPDDDDDGLTDEQELANGLNPLDETDAAADPDGDGYSSFDEITIYGTDPLDASSAPSTGRIELASAFSAVGEQELQLEMHVVRLGGTVGTASVDFATEARNAVDGGDFTPTSGTLNWAADDNAPKTIIIDITNDSVIENTEYFVVRLTNATGANLGFDRTLVEINDEDSAPNPGVIKFRHSRLSTEEGGGSVAYEVVRTGGSAGNVSIDYNITGTNGLVVGADVLANVGTLSWTDGDMSARTITVDVMDDNQPEVTELFEINLFNPVGGVGFVGTNTESILDDDLVPAGGLVGFSKGLFFVLEGEEFGEAPIYRINGKSGDSGPLLLNTLVFSLPPFGTALPGQDYLNTPAGIQFADNDEGLRKHLVPIIDDNVFEGLQVELFLTQLSINGSSTVIPDRPNDPSFDYGTFVVFDDDQPVDGGVLGLTQSNYVVSEVNPVFRVERSGGITGAVTYDIDVAGDVNESHSGLYAINGGGTRDYVLAVDTNESEDRVATITLSSSALGLATLGITTATITVKNDRDSDGVYDEIDTFPDDASETTDTDTDGIGNNADLDDDNDGVEDVVEALIGSDPLDGATSLDPALKNCIVGTAQLQGITSVAQFTNLDCSGQGVTSLAGIEGMYALTQLHVNDNSISDITPVGSLASIQNVDFGNNLVSDVSALANATTLTGIGAWNNNVTDLNAIAGLTGLGYIDFGGNGASDISMLDGLVNLQWVYLWGNGIADISVVTNWTTLRQLNVDGNELTDLPAIPASIEWFNANWNQLTDVDELDGFTHLRDVVVTDNLITSMPDLSQSPDLSFVNFDRNALTAIGALPFNLRHLSVQGNRISDLSPLTGISGMEALDINDNHLDNADVALGSPLLSLTNLIDLQIQTNAIDAFDDLFNSLTTTAITSDAGLPTITSVVLTPSDFLNVDNYGQLDISAVTSDNSGGQVYLTSPQGVRVSIGFPPDGNPSTIWFDPYSDKGVWQVSEIEIYGSSGYRRYNEYGVQVLLSSFDTDIDIQGSAASDIEPPQLQSVSISEATVDVSSGPVLVNFSATFTDNLSGMSYIHMQLQNENFETVFDGNSGQDQNGISFDYPVGIEDVSVIRINWLNAGDHAGNNRGRDYIQLVSEGYSALVNVTGAVAPAAIVGGQFNASEGSYPGAKGNPSYQFDVGSTSVVGVGFTWDSGFGNGARFVLRDSGGNVVLSTENNYSTRPTIGIELAPDTYSLEVRADCCVYNDPFTLRFVGDVSNVQVDTDGDGILDALDPDDDNDGIADVDENIYAFLNPLDRTDALADYDGDGASNLAEILAGSDPADGGNLPPTVGALLFADPGLVQCLSDAGYASVYATDVTNLYCEFYNIADLGGIEQLVSLTDLNLGNNQISDISPLSGLTHLQQLNIHQNQITDISPLAGMYSLGGLGMWSNQVTDLSPLAGLNLGYIDFGGNGTSDISILATMTSLGSVHAWGNNISDASAISSLSNLTDINLNTNALTSLPPLPVSLRQFRAEDNQLSDVSALEGLTELQGLWLNRNQLTALPDLTAATNLWNIDVGVNQLTELEGLPDNIRSIQAWNNRIDDLTALVGKSNLQYLNLDNNYLDDGDVMLGSPLLGLTQLVDFNLGTNAISDFADLHAVFDGGPTFQTDENRPSITGVTFIPDDTLDLDTDTHFRYTIVNSANEGGSIQFTSPQGVVLNLGFPPNGFEDNYWFGLYSDKGVWQVTQVEIYGPNYRRYNAYGVQKLLKEIAAFDTDIELVGGLGPDVVPPVLQSLTSSHTSVDLGGGPIIVEFTATFSDDLSGMGFTHMQLSDQNGFVLKDVNTGQGQDTVTGSYVLGFEPLSELRVNWLNAGDQGSNSRGKGYWELIDDGYPAGISVTGGSVSSADVKSGQFHASEGSYPGARGNPSYQFDVTSGGVAAAAFAWPSTNFGGARLVIADLAGNVIVTTEGFYSDHPQIGADLAVGTYVVEVRADCCSVTESFDLTFIGDVSNVQLDTDGDGVVDTIDGDDDDDGTPDGSDADPFNWSIQ